MAILALAVGAALAISVATASSAGQAGYTSVCPLSTVGEASDCPELPSLTATFGGWVVPKRLPRYELAPVGIGLWGKVATTDGTHLSALRELTIDLDRDIVVNATGLPVCRTGGRDWSIGNLRKACRHAVVGEGKVDFEIALPENAQTSAQIPFLSNLTVFNGGYVAGVLTLYAVTSVDAPVPPRTIVIPIEIRRIHKGHYGLGVVAKIPVIAGGSGSLLDFSLKVKRLFGYKGTPKSIALARCADGHFRAKVSALFRNEIEMPAIPPSTSFASSLALPCTPLG